MLKADLLTVFENGATTMANAGVPPAPGFPFRTRSAEKVYVKIQELANGLVTFVPEELVRSAREDADISAYELTPEDVSLLVMAAQELLAAREP